MPEPLPRTMSPDLGPAPPDDLLVLTWNVLADGLAASGGFLRTRPEDLGWELRGERILTEILDHRSNGRAPDVVCLQEVDHFDDFLAPRLAAHGYRGSFHPKEPDRDGCCVVWREERFVDATIRCLRYTDPRTGAPRTQLAVIADLTSHDGRSLRLATTHLKAKAGHEEVRAEQVRELLAALADTEAPLLVGGDFNDVPGSPAHALMASHPLGLSSSYADLASGAEPDWTTWKVRATGEARRTIDYLWHSEDLRPVACLSIPADHDIGPTRLPSDRYPSDHLALLVRYRLGEQIR